MVEDNQNRNTELLYRLDEKVVEVLRRMGEQDKEISEFRAASNSVHSNLTNRINALENFRWWFLGVAATVSIVSNFVKDWITSKF